MIDKKTTDKARALYYGLLSKMFVYSTKEDRFEGIDDALAIITTNPLDEHSANAAKRLLEIIDTKGIDYLKEEFEVLFHLFYGKEVKTSASYYLEGIEAGEKLVEVRSFLARTNIRRDESFYKDNEDTIPFLLSFMKELIEEEMSGEKSYANIEHCLFNEVINPFIDRFIEQLFNHEKSDAYKDVAIILNSFIEFERLYFEIARPAKQEVVKTKKELEYEKEMARRAANRAKKEADKFQKSYC